MRPLGECGRCCSAPRAGTRLNRGDALRRMQDADDRVAALRSEIETIETTLRGDAELDRRRGSAASASTARRTAEEEAAAAESELEALQKRVRALDRRLYDGSVRNPQELMEMQRELETMRERVAAVEGRALDLLEAAEAAQADEQAASSAVSARESQRAAELGPLQERRAARSHELDDAVAARDSALADLDPADVRLYERVSAKHRPAVARLSGDACGGCHLPLSIEERRAVRTGSDLVQCPNCDRIVVP
jgi:predicted  nucleic acid-binding Zn-ribbon protein